MTAEVDTTGAVLVETDADGVRTLTFNRPERRNGWSSDLEDAYYGALTDAAADQGCEPSSSRARAPRSAPARHGPPRRPLGGRRQLPAPTGRRAAGVPEAARRRDQRGVRGRRAGAGAVLPRPLRRRLRALLHRVRPARPRRRVRHRLDLAPAGRPGERAGPAAVGPAFERPRPRHSAWSAASCRGTRCSPRPRSTPATSPGTARPRPSP